MSFDEVIGQKEAEERLLQLVREERLPHALMLCGPQGCGKLPLAVAFACYLLDNGTPSAKAMLAKLEHPDLHFTYPTIKLPSMGAEHKPVSDDFAKDWHELVMRGLYFTMEEWMTAMGAENQQAIITAGESDDLVRKLSLKSSQGGYKVSVIWLPERMNIECANKLLKLIEEPPQQTVFIMVCEEPDKLLETIRSRVQRIDVKKISNEAIEQALNSPLLNNNDVYKSKKILLHIVEPGPDGDQPLMVDEIADINEFMGKMEDGNLETKWGMSYDPSLKDQVKITILASGFGLSDINSEEMNQRIAEKNEAELRIEEEKRARREGIYGSDTKGGYIHKQINYYIFKDQDLDNDNLISSVVSVPTYKRKKSQLEQLENISNGITTNTVEA